MGGFGHRRGSASGSSDGAGRRWRGRRGPERRRDPDAGLEVSAQNDRDSGSVGRVDDPHRRAESTDASRFDDDRVGCPLGHYRLCRALRFDALVERDGHIDSLP